MGRIVLTVALIFQLAVGPLFCCCTLARLGAKPSATPSIQPAGARRAQRVLCNFEARLNLADDQGGALLEPSSSYPVKWLTPSKPGQYTTSLF